MGFENWAKIAGGKNNEMSTVRKGQGAKSRTNPSTASGGVKRSKKLERRSRKTDRSDKAIAAEIVDREKEWQAESDLDALNRAAAIIDSPERVKAAKKKALERARQAQEAAANLEKIGG
jgi:thiamine biosynthesis lipoprotein ApbE